MAIEPGTTLLHYRLVEKIGEGGMGVVWKAVDTTLDREVAIKILPEELAGHPERLQRLQREARTVAALNHPHIVTLHSVDEAAGHTFLTMELVEGETLADRLTRGALPRDETLRYGVQIASALAEAHRQGIIHRDLKPANVMITPTGAKLLDFGLAKAAAPESAPGGTALPTRTHELTQEGTILGTFQYMSPEQLEGKDADARSDIFAFGALLYEMLSGKKAFAGASQASVIASIMGADPPALSAVQPMTPPALERVVQGCLAKSPEDRWGTAHDVMLQLRWIAEAGSEAGVPVTKAARRRVRERVWIGLAAVLFASTALLVIGWVRWVEPETLRIRASITAPEGQRFDFGGPHTGGLTLSPDGRFVAFTAEPQEGGEAPLWVRRLDEAEAHELPGTEWATYPFWSPDSRFIGFFDEDGQMSKVAAEGGPVIKICDAPNARGGTWNEDDVILFEPHWSGPIYRVSADGGTPQQVTTLDSERGETTHRWPTFLPDGRHFLYLAGSHGTDVVSGENVIFVQALDSPDRRLLLHARSQVHYANGHLLYQRDRDVVAHPFDADALQLTGDPFVVARRVRYEKGFFQGVFAVSQTGIFAFQHGEEESTTELAWYDRSGQELEKLGDRAVYFTVRISPDGASVAATVGDTSDLWLFDLERGTRIRLTSAPENEGSPIWSPDGSAIAYNSDAREGNSDLMLRSIQAGGVAEALLQTDAIEVAGDWSLDGKHLAYTSYDRRDDRDSAADVWILPLEGDREPYPFVDSEFREIGPRFSPDGKRLAYNSNASGEWEIYVTSFPEKGTTRMVSRGSGYGARWSSDGRELYYVSDDETLYAVPLGGESGLEAGVPKALFSTRFFWGNFEPAYDVAPGGQRFLLAPWQPIDEPVSLLVGWNDE